MCTPYYIKQMTAIRHHRPTKLSENGFSLDYNRFVEDLSGAQYALGVLQGSQKKLHNPSLLISPLTAKEATVSSRIEGTQSTVSDVFLHEAGGAVRHSDVQQVANYRKAMRYVVDEIRKGRSLSTSVIKTLHHVLLSGVRHKGTIGTFRDKPVWIAEKEGDPIEKAIYIPPEHYFVQDYMDDLLTFIHRKDLNMLVRAGIAHYQFEAVHPFEDGNGRVGRLLIPLVLCYGGKLSEPILYLSGYFDAHREEYINALHQVDKDGDYGSWLSFFLRCVAGQIKETQELVEAIYALYDKIRQDFATMKSPYVVHFIDFLFKSPIFSTAMLKQSFQASELTYTRLIKNFEERKLITVMPYRRGRFKLYRFNPLLKILS